MPTITSTLGALAALAIKLTAAKDWDSPAYNYLYQYPLPIPPVKTPKTKVDFPDGPSIEYYEIDIKPFEQQVYPNLGKTRLVGYDGIAPGPTFMMRKGTEAVVRFINHADRANSVHLHGSYSRAPFDGWAEDTTDVNSYKDYYYPNGQNARTLWYHDHAIDHTAENAYMGQAGMYILHDTEEEAVKGLPQGKDYDIPLVLASKRYNPDGSLWSPEANHETTNLFGDVIHVNGQPWPYLKVEPRKYRFRLLDASISRSFQLYLEQATKVGTRLNFKVVGSDAGLLLNPVDTTQLDISMAERYEIVVDFSPFKSSNVTMRSNKKVADNTDYIHTDKIMQFVVGDTISDPNYKAEDLPAKLRDVPFPPAHAGIEHQFEFQRTGGEWKINGVDWADGPEKRILAKPPRGAVENWVLKNGAGGWTHPVHIHLVDFQVVARTGGSRGGVQPYEKVALKDVVWLNTNEQVNVIARYAPWDGVYMFHCHNLIHEDNEMMAAFNVTALSDLGYDEKTSFIDPMETRYRAKHFSDSDLTSRSGDFSDDNIKAKIGFFHALEGYKNAGTAEEKLVEYWSTHTSGAAAATGSATTLVTRVSSATGSTTPSAAAAAASSVSSKASGSKSDDTVASSTGSSASASTTA